MNFLAHLYLSNDDPDIMLGNFLTDFLMRRDYARYNTRVQMGFELHHTIDFYTDHHDLVKQSMAFFKPKFGRYSSGIVDIVFDDFLAAEWESFFHISPTTLPDFAEKSYTAILQQPNILPDVVRRFLPRMQSENWLVQYGHIDGLRRALLGISRRATFQHNLDEAVPIVQEHYAELKENVHAFIPDIYRHCQEYLRTAS